MFGVNKIVVSVSKLNFEIFAEALSILFNEPVAMETFPAKLLEVYLMQRVIPNAI